MNINEDNSILITNNDLYNTVLCLTRATIHIIDIANIHKQISTSAQGAINNVDSTNNDINVDIQHIIVIIIANANFLVIQYFIVTGQAICKKIKINEKWRLFWKKKLY